MTQSRSMIPMTDLPYTPQAELPSPFKESIAQMIAEQKPLDNTFFELLSVESSQAQLKRSYYVALIGSWLILIGSLVAGFAVGSSVSWISGVIMVGIFGTLGLVALWLWAGKRRGLAKDRFYEMGMATKDVLIIRDLGTFRIIPLKDVTETYVEVMTSNGMVGDIKLILIKPQEEIRWFGLTSYTVDQVEAFSHRINLLLQHR